MKKGQVVTWIAAAAGLGLLIFPAMFPDHTPAALLTTKDYRDSAIMGTVILGLLIAGKMWKGDLLYRSPPWKAENMNVTIAPEDRPITAGELTILRIGGISAPSFSLQLSGNDGAIIVPPEAVTPYGRGGIIKANLKLISFSRLPPEVRRALAAEDIKGPYYIGHAPAYVETHGRDFTAEVRAYHDQIEGKFNSDSALRRSAREHEDAARALGTMLRHALESRPKRWWEGLFGGKTNDDTYEESRRDAT